MPGENGSQTQEPPAPKLFKEIAPAELHDRGWIKPFLDKPYTPELGVELAKKLDGAETLIGKKTLIPGPEAKPEEVEAFYSKLGLEKPEGYDIKGLGEKPDEAFAKEIQTAAHKGRLTQKQLNDFLAAMMPGVEGRRKAQSEAQEKLNKEFDDLVAKTYAKDNEKVVDRVKAAMDEFMPEPFKPYIATLDNKALAVVTGVVNAILVKYGLEDKLDGKSGGDGGAVTREALQKEARELQASKAWLNFQDPDHEKTRKRVAEIYANPLFK